MKINYYTSIILLAASFLSSCSKDEDSSSAMKNDFIKKTTAPAIVGQQLEFAYAMGSPLNTLSKATAQASIAGDANTGFGLYSYYTTSKAITADGVSYNAGQDVPLQTVREANTEGNLSTAVMADKIDEVYVNPMVPHGTNMVDMHAATLRYYYTVPEAARGQEVSFSFRAEAGNESASLSTPSYKVSRMDMARLIEMQSDAVCYFSIADMKAYSQAEEDAQNLSGKIDFIYHYQANVDGYAYGHAFVSPGTAEKYLGTTVVPANWTKNKTLMEKRIDIFDAQLKGDLPNDYIDDIDFETLELGHAFDFSLGFAANNGAFMQTADGAYAAYIYVNSASNDGKMTVSIKRYPLR